MNDTVHISSMTRISSIMHLPSIMRLSSMIHITNYTHIISVSSMFFVFSRLAPSHSAWFCLTKTRAHICKYGSTYRPTNIDLLFPWPSPPAATTTILRDCSRHRQGPCWQTHCRDERGVTAARRRAGKLAIQARETGHLRRDDPRLPAQDSLLPHPTRTARPSPPPSAKRARRRH